MSTEMISRNSDILFLYDATNTNVNGDPDQENRPRMDYETKTALVSDVRIKRTIRDFLVEKGYGVFVRTLNDRKVTMEKMFEEVMRANGMDPSEKKGDAEEKVKIILDQMIDMRLFGSAMAVGGITRTFTGPVQISWGYSLHPADIVKSGSIVTIMNEDNSTFGKMYKLHYGLFAHSATVNKFAAAKTKMTQEDKEVFKKALIQSMMNHLTHSKQGQRPLLYLEVEYGEKFDGYLGDMRRFLKTEFLDGEGNPALRNAPVRELAQMRLDFGRISEIIEQMKEKGYIHRVSLWRDIDTDNFVNLPAHESLDLLSALS